MNSPNNKIFSAHRLTLMLWIACAVFSFEISSRSIAAQNVTYYVDSVGGNDNNSGTSQSAAWASLTKVNGHGFQPGDNVLFLAGDTWNGQLAPTGSGTAGAPITLGSYGSGNKPLIQGQGAVPSAVQFTNQHDITLTGFEITNTNGQPFTSSTPFYNGVTIVATDVGPMGNITIENNFITNLEGPTSGEGSAHGGIVAYVTGTTVPTYYTNMVLQDNEISNLPTMYGIVTFSSWMQRDGYTGFPFWNLTSSNTGPWVPSTGTIIRGNYVHDIGQGGISPNMISGAVIEHNVVRNVGFDHNNTDIWWSMAENTVAQFNDVSYENMVLGEEYGDAALDADASTYGSLMQYNFGHNNAFGTIETCYAIGHLTARYNISQNDTGWPVNLSCASSATIDLYNNSVYAGLYQFVPYTQSESVVLETLQGMTDISSGSMSFTNDVFINPNSVGYQQVSGSPYDNNLYDDGNGSLPDTLAPTDPNGYYGNAYLQSAGNASSQDNLSDYTPDSNSPAYSSGVAISGLVGPTNGGRDIFGTQIPSSSLSIGAIQTGPGATAPTVTSSLSTGLGSLSDIVDNISTTAWAPTSGTSGTITIQYPTTQTFSALEIGVWYGLGQGITNLNIETWDASTSSWVTQVSGAPLSWASNSSLVEYRTIELPAAVTTTQVMIVVNSANNEWGHFAINDLHLWNWLPPLTSTTLGGSGISEATDSQLNTAWLSQNSPSFPGNIEMDFRSPRTISSVTLYTWYGLGQGITNLDVQTLSGGVWTTQVSNYGLTWSSNNNTIESRTISLPGSETVSGVRLVVHSANLEWGHLALNELTAQ